MSEKGKDALKKISETGERPSSSAPKVKGGAKGKKKAASKKAKSAGKKSAEPAGDVKKHVDKILKYTPSKSAGKKETPSKGKASTKRSVSKKHGTPSMPSPGGKQSTRTTD